MNQSPKAKRRPSSGGNPSISEDKSQFGSNLHTTTGGGTDAFHGPKNAAGKAAAGNHGVEAGDPGTSFDEGTSGGSSTSNAGSTLSKRGVD